ncbi:MAG: hypothetical protein ACI8WB_003527 [Phenylobacterium sp.]|jgi:hypothetical protein
MDQASDRAVREKGESMERLRVSIGFLADESEHMEREWKTKGDVIFNGVLAGYSRTTPTDR